MTWLFAALWKLPASNSLTTTAEAQECVYGSVGGPKRPRSKLSLSRMYQSFLPAVAKAQHRRMHSKLWSECPFADRAVRKRLGGLRVPANAPIVNRRR